MSGLGTTLMDEAWRQVRPHQRTPVKFTLLGLLLATSDYDTRATHYLVEGFREGFQLRLNRPVDQIASDMRSNKRVVKGNNKTALDNPQAMEAKLEKELLAKRMIVPFLGPVFPSYIISPLSLWKKKVPGKFRIIHDLSAPFEGISINSCIPTKDGCRS